MRSGCGIGLRPPSEALVAAGAVAAASPAEAAKDADVVITMLSDDAAARAVWLDPNFGACAMLKAGAVAIESSTVTPDWIAELGAGRGARAALVDAPVAGSLPQAEAGQLVFLIGGEPDAVAAVKPTLAPLGAAFHHLGPLGRGARFKLAVNLLLGAQVACVAEVLGGLAADGFDERQAAELIAGSAVASPASANYARIMAERRPVKLFPVDLLAKDLGYAVKAMTGERPRLAYRRRRARPFPAGLGGRLRRGECHRGAKTVWLRRRRDQLATALDSKIATARKS